MTLDEAIKHCLEKAKEEKRKLLKVGDIYACSKCAEEHEQLAKWLEELKDYRRFNGAKTFDNGFKQGEKYGYKKAIDDFVKNIKECSGWTPNCIESWHDVCLTIYTLHQIAEELKKDGAE